MTQNNTLSILTADPLEELPKEKYKHAFDVLILKPKVDIGGKDLIPWLPLIPEIAKDSAHLYLICELEHFPALKWELEKQGWSVLPAPLIHHKTRATHIPLPEHGPKNQYEIILFAFRGGRKVKRILSDVITTTSSIFPEASFFYSLFERSVSEGDKVVCCVEGGRAIVRGCFSYLAPTVYIDTAHHFTKEAEELYNYYKALEAGKTLK